MVVTINKTQIENIKEKLQLLKVEVTQSLFFVDKAWRLLDFDEKGEASLSEEQKTALLTAYANHKNDMQDAYNELP